MLPPGFEKKLEIKTKSITVLRLNADVDLVSRALADLKHLNARKQIEVVEYLEQLNGRLPVSQVLEKVQCSRSIIKALVSKGIIFEETIDVDRNPWPAENSPWNFRLPSPVIRSRPGESD